METLSDKRNDSLCFINENTGDYYISEADVKEFIKNLKSYLNDCNHASPEQQIEELEKLAGEELNGKK